MQLPCEVNGSRTLVARWLARYTRSPNYWQPYMHPRLINANTSGARISLQFLFLVAGFINCSVDNQIPEYSVPYYFLIILYIFPKFPQKNVSQKIVVLKVGLGIALINDSRSVGMYICISYP